MKRNFLWVLVPFIMLLLSCSADFNIVGRKNLWIDFSRSLQSSKYYGVFMWEYELDKDSVTLYGKKYRLPIKEVFAEPSYHFRDYKTDSLQILNIYHIVFCYNDTLPRLDSLEETRINGCIISPSLTSQGIKYPSVIMYKDTIFPPDTMRFYITIFHYYRDSTGSQFDSRGYSYCDSLGNTIFHIDTLDSFKIIRKR